MNKKRGTVIMKLKKGDKIIVTAGKDRGKEGAVEKLWLKEDKVTVNGVNMGKRHSKPRGQGQKGSIVDFVRPLHISKVALVCPRCKKPTKIGYKLLKDNKIRICRKCEQEI
jgi:large subunit ribosomal protein L24